MTIRLSFISLAVASLCPVMADAPARPFVSPLFSDNMVLQREQEDHVWGWSKPGDNITVAIDGHDTSATANADGKWVATILPPAVGGPYQLDITGPQQAHFKNVMVGDVWICTGQSNMTLGIKLIKDAQAEIAAADHPDLRIFNKDGLLSLDPSDQVGGSWSVCTPAGVNTPGMGFSATAYFFGRDLQADLKIPVGLIHTSWGGTPIEGWSSEEGLAKATHDFDKQLQIVAAAREKKEAGTYDYVKEREAWYQAADAGVERAATDYDDSSWNTITLPSSLDATSETRMPQGHGVVFFRKTINLPPGTTGKNGRLSFSMVRVVDDTMVNGVDVGAGSGNGGRDYFVPYGVLKAGKNVISVRTFDRNGNAGIYSDPKKKMSLTLDGGEPISLEGEWKYHVGPSLASAPEFPDDVANNTQLPSNLFNGMIAPLLQFGIKGVIWYQGESNAGRGYQYRTLLPAMIADWRSKWGEGNFPFIIVQLANFMDVQKDPMDAGWAELREAQWLTTQKVPNTGLATAIDIGEADNIHPKNKQEIGRRLSLTAQALVYHENVEYSGPVYRSMASEGSRIRIKFSHADRLHIQSNGPADSAQPPVVGGAPVVPPLMDATVPLKGFAIAGADNKFVWADASIDGNDVVVSSAQVTNPVAVRYDWGSNPQGNLYNGAGLPALPFRTDDLPLSSLNAK